MLLSNSVAEAWELDWDTKYFGISCAKLLLKDEITQNDFLRIIKLLKEYEFITMVNLANNPYNNWLLGLNTNAFLTDINIIFKKSINEDANYEKDYSLANIEIYNNLFDDKAIENISKHAFVYSRFYNDFYIDKKKSNNIYLNWVQNSFKCSEKFFALYKIDNNTVGFILFSLNEHTRLLLIELIAIDKSYVGKKIGKKLVKAVECFSKNNGYTEIEVGTQTNNILAQNFYYKCGFCISNCDSIYHWWPNNN